MMRIFVLTVALFMVAFAANGQFNQVDSKGKKQGEWRKNYQDSKQLRYKGQFENDIEIGKFIYFHENGNIKFENVYRGKTRVCYSKQYSMAGVLIAEGVYNKNVKDSTWRYYSDALGILISEETYRNGKKDGLAVIYFKDGKVAERIHYKMDVKHGKWEQFFEDGRPKTIANYDNGKLQGEAIYYSDLSNKPKSKGVYNKGLKDGVWFYWGDDGRPEWREQYENGILKKKTKL